LRLHFFLQSACAVLALDNLSQDVFSINRFVVSEVLPMKADS
uniref:DUF2948 family protein n=1 Tax=Haemonchus placei TaxID=6290 RepID=A0A0N4WBZ3_HAEPC